MSNTIRCRELHGGKLTRPKKLWKGRKRYRGSPTTGYRAAAGMFTRSPAADFTRNFGQMSFRRKEGGS